MTNKTRLPDIKPPSSFTARPIEWLWDNRIPIGKLSMIAGDPGLGKGLVTLDMAARVSTGTPFPDSTSPVAEGDVVLLSGEDDIADTVLPRLLAAGGNPKRVHALKSVVTMDGAHNKVAEELFTLDCVAELEEGIGWCATPRLIVIDPVPAFLGRGTDANDNVDVRSALLPLQDLAERHRVAVVMVSHLNKSSGRKSVHRVMGSLAFTAAARASFLVVKSKQDPGQRFFLPSKTNLGPDHGGLSYTIEGTEIAADGNTIETCRAVWGAEPVSLTADEALAQDMGITGEDSASEEWARKSLAGGEKVLSSVLYENAARDGFGEAEVRRALKSVGARRSPTHFQGPWAWHLPVANNGVASSDLTP